MRPPAPTEDLGAPMDFVLPDGSWVRGTSVQAWWHRHDAWIVDLGLRFELSPEAWSRVDFAEAFHLDARARGSCFGGDLSLDRPVRVEVRLERALTHVLRPRLADLQAWATLVRTRPAEDPLHKSELWRALSVSQAHRRAPGKLAVGFKTVWGA